MPRPPRITDAGATSPLSFRITRYFFTMPGPILMRWMCLLLVFLPPLVWGQGGPPLRTDDPGTPGNGNWEINVGLTSDRRQTERQFEAPLVDINYGLGDHLQLKFEMPYLVQGADNAPTRASFGDGVAGVKWRFLENKKHDLAISFYPQLGIDSPTDVLESGATDYGRQILLPLEITKKLGPVDANLEVGRWVTQHGPDQWLTGLAFGRQVTPKFEALAELYNLRAVHAHDRETTFGLGGRLRLTKSLLFLIMAGRSFSGPSSGQPQFIGYAGLQIQLERKHAKQESDTQPGPSNH